jgi:hypothetical protein
MARKILLMLGSQILGWASSGTWVAIAKINDLQKLESPIDRLDQVGSWKELLPEEPIERPVQNADSRQRQW